MKRFIYLDTETLDSYIAQIYKGKVESFSESNQSNIESNNKTTQSIKPATSADLKILGKGFDAKAELFLEKIKSNNESSIINKLETKALHDYSFDLLMNYVEENNSLIGDKIGSFVDLKSNFYIIDLLYYKDLFNNDQFISYLIESTLNDFETDLSKQIEELPKTNLNKTALNKIKQNNKKTINDKRKSLTEEYDNIKDIYNMITCIIPYKRLLVMNDFIVILNDKFMRDDSLMTSFKYGGKVNLYGYITNIIGNETNQELPFLSQTINIINSSVLPFFVDKSSVNIVHPIAIYY